MKKEFEIIKEAEVMDNNMLGLVKGGGNENTESCCHIQFSCNLQKPQLRSHVFHCICYRSAWRGKHLPHLQGQVDNGL